jgi:hypothetical protein
VYLLEYDVGVRAIWQRYGCGRGQRCIRLSIGLYVLLGWRLPQWHRGRHAEGRLGLVDGAERALLVDLGMHSPLGLHILAAPSLVPRKGGDGEGGSRGRGRSTGGLLGRVGQRQRGRGCPPVRGRASRAGGCAGAERDAARPPQRRADIRDRGCDGVPARLSAVMWRRGHFRDTLVLAGDGRGFVWRGRGGRGSRGREIEDGRGRVGAPVGEGVARSFGVALGASAAKERPREEARRAGGVGRVVHRTCPALHWFRVRGKGQGVVTGGRIPASWRGRALREYCCDAARGQAARGAFIRRRDGCQSCATGTCRLSRRRSAPACPATPVTGT